MKLWQVILFIGWCILVPFIIMFAYYLIFKHKGINEAIEAEERQMEEEGVK